MERFWTAPAGAMRAGHGRQRRNPVRGAIFNAPIAQLVERLVEAQEAAGSKPARCTTSCWPVAQLAEHSAVTGDAAGSSPAWPATFRLGEMAEKAQGSCLLNRRGKTVPNGFDKIVERCWTAIAGANARRRPWMVRRNPTLSTRCARIAQRESAALTKRKSLVQSQVRAPLMRR